MKQITTSFILMILSFQMIAQDYAPLAEGRSYLFASDKSYQAQVGTLGFRVDSSWVNGGNRYFQPLRVPYYCLDQWQPLPRLLWPISDRRAYPWLQGSYFCDSAHSYVFQNQFQESILIRTHSQPGASWRVYTYPDSSSIFAKHDSTVFKQVFSGWDSVKYFHLQLLDSLGDSLQSSLNGTEIQLAKDNGLIQTIRFECFPRGILDTFFTGDKSMVLYQIGATHPDVGKYPLAERHILNYEVNDTFQIEAKYFNDPDYWGQSFTQQIIKNKNQAGQKVTYQIARRVWDVEYAEGRETIRCWEDTTNLTVDLSIPAPLPLIPDPQGYVYDYSENHFFAGKRYRIPSAYVYYSAVDSCFIEPIDGYGFSSLVGIGHHFGGSRRNPFPPTSFRLPIYYRKGSTSWGTYLNFDSLSCTVGLEKNLLRDIHVTYQDNQLRIQQDDPQQLDFQLLSMDARILISRELASESEHQISLSSLPQGLYIYHLRGKKGQWKTGKFVKGQ